MIFLKMYENIYILYMIFKKCSCERKYIDILRCVILIMCLNYKFVQKVKMIVLEVYNFVIDFVMNFFKKRMYCIVKLCISILCEIEIIIKNNLV